MGRGLFADGLEVFNLSLKFRRRHFACLQALPQVADKQRVRDERKETVAECDGIGQPALTFVDEGEVWQDVGIGILEPIQDSLGLLQSSAAREGLAEPTLRGGGRCEELTLLEMGERFRVVLEPEVGLAHEQMDPRRRRKGAQKLFSQAERLPRVPGAKEELAMESPSLDRNGIDFAEAIQQGPRFVKPAEAKSPQDPPLQDRGDGAHHGLWAPRRAGDEARARMR